ncbi:hypothetical protein [Kordiimonas marina]|uniref:hypothetical protein n=1 Tax=Kordiimonas marina TaxID=2872312 RepID=UPI001FF317EA|nr:hypothetical protein [Kordiimonas marina]MCJ9428985.1 hypothetical protein [Kordiimonas marina]
MEPTQLAFSFIAITLLALIARWLFPVKKQLDAERVSRNFARCYPDLVQGQAIIADDGAAALLPIAANDTEVGLVTQPGDRVVCRLLVAADIAALERKDDRLHIRFHDFTYPDLDFMASGVALDTAHNLLKNLDVKATKNAA